MKFGIKEGFLVAVVLALLGGCFLVLRPFWSSLLWAVVLVCSSWPVYSRLLKFVGNRHSLAAFLMTLGMILILLLPFVVVGTTLADNVKALTSATKTFIDQGPPAPPEWLAKIPLVGQRVTDYWQNLAADTGQLWTHAEKLVEPASALLLTGGLFLASGLIKLALSIFIAFFLFRGGATVGAWATALVRHIAGERGEHLLTVAGNTVRGVVYGILGTALTQAVLAGIGFLIAGVPGAMLLALLTFFSSIVPVLGTALTWGPAAIWLFHQGRKWLGHFHAGLGRGRRERGQRRQAVAHQPGQQHAVPADFFRRARRRADVRFHRCFSGADAAGGRLQVGGGMGDRQQAHGIKTVGK